MPLDHINFKGRRRGSCHNACKENGQSLCTDLVNGPAAPNSCKASASTTSESTPAVSLNGTKLQCMVNGYISHWCKGKSTKTEQKECKRISVSVTDAPAVSGLHADNSDQTTPNQPSSRKWKKFNRKKRDINSLSPENCEFPSSPPRTEENWENETQDITPPFWGNYEVKPYGPEDVLNFAMRDLTLVQRGTVNAPVATNYIPVMHHQLPVPWRCCKLTPVPDQFADAEE